VFCVCIQIDCSDIKAFALGHHQTTLAHALLYFVCGASVVLPSLLKGASHYMTYYVMISNVLLLQANYHFASFVPSFARSLAMTSHSHHNNNIKFFISLFKEQEMFFAFLFLSLRFSFSRKATHALALYDASFVLLFLLLAVSICRISRLHCE
jgi:hypothetical protein